MMYRPCGACRELVSVLTGCPHWRPNQTVAASRNRERRSLEKDKLEAFRRAMKLGQT
jgi:hypothetical protein